VPTPAYDYCRHAYVIFDKLLGLPELGS
jgi:hypothetical protein